MNSEGGQSFYERMPYPVPLTSLDEHLAIFKSPERRRIHSLLMFPSGEPASRQQILVAGCGASQAAKVALREPDSRVMAIDISGTSLSHLRALQQKYELENLRNPPAFDSRCFVAGADLRPDHLHGCAASSSRPDQGLRCLREVLRPDSAMQITVYASYGRTGICVDPRSAACLTLHLRHRN